MSSRWASTRRERRSTTTATPPARRARSRRSSRSTCAKASPAPAAERGSRRSGQPAAGPITARAASGRRLSRDSEDLFERSVAVGFQEFAEAAYDALADDDLREGHLAGALHQAGPAVRVLRQAYLFVVHATTFQQGLRLSAE